MEIQGKKWPRNSVQREMFIQTASVGDTEKSFWEEGQISKMSWVCGREGTYYQDIEALACKKSGPSNLAATSSPLQCPGQGSLTMRPSAL